MPADSEPEPDLLPDFRHPMSRASLRERLETWAEALDLSLPRLVVGAIVLALLGVAGWRLLAPPTPPAEMTLPMVSGTEQATATNEPSGEIEGTAAHGDTSPAEQVGPSGSARPVASSSEAEVVVHVAGAVHAPGVQRLGSSARIVDAVDASGGATGDADLARVNLAAPLEDGQQVYIPRVGEEPPQPLAMPGGDAGVAGGTSGEASAPGGLVNINTAGIAELETLHGVGPAIAQAIVDHRDKQGPFASVEQLTEVRGIGEAKLEGLRERVTV